MKKGFTIIELITVVAIIALLVGILIPALSRIRQHVIESSGVEKPSKIEQATTIPIKENNSCIGRVGELQKIELKLSVVSAEGYTIYVKDLPANAYLHYYESQYIILWEPEHQIKQEITVITVSGDGKLQEEVKMLIEAY